MALDVVGHKPLGSAERICGLQLFFKRSTVYIPFVLVGAYFANEVRRALGSANVSDGTG
jgi:hypothetical protein